MLSRSLATVWGSRGMAAFIDMVGFRAGRLGVVGLSHMSGHKAYWRCKCDCGRETIVVGNDLRNGKTRSCGCFRSEKSAARTRTHGASRTALYNQWRGMLTRCDNSRQKTHKYYGALGVRVCDRWRDFEKFAADVGVRPAGKTLDRRNPFGDYEPNNWRWATWSEQRLNTRENFVVWTVVMLGLAAWQSLYDRLTNEAEGEA